MKNANKTNTTNTYLMCIHQLIIRINQKKLFKNIHNRSENQLRFSKFIMQQEFISAHSVHITLNTTQI